MCKICFSKDLNGDDDAKLISPCKCKGSLAHVHEDCLQKWMKIKYGTKCELCGHAIKHLKRAKPLRNWVSPKLKLWDILWSLTSIVGIITSIITIWYSQNEVMSKTAEYILITLGLSTLLASMFLMISAIYINKARIQGYIRENQIWRICESTIDEKV
ncbi:hypothetical protein MXB_4543 [Myxobolus squamalis]|nr:hypothetical protein MXB_4543 [Myxobolus squamalis]